MSQIDITKILDDLGVFPSTAFYFDSDYDLTVQLFGKENMIYIIILDKKSWFWKLINHKKLFKAVQKDFPIGIDIIISYTK